MKVTLLTGEYPPMRGGVADYTALLADGLTRQGVDVSVLTSVRASSARGATPMVLPNVTSWGAGLWTSVARHVADNHPDLIHIQYQTGAFDMRLGVNFLPWIGRIRGGQPRIVVTFHDLKEPYILPKLGPARHVATIALAAGADAIVITNSEDSSRVTNRQTTGLTRWIWGRRPVATIPIGSNIPPAGADFDRSIWRARFGARDDDLVLAYFGFLSPSKGVDTLAEACEVLIKKGRPVRLLMVGAPTGDTGRPDRQYENSIRTLLDRPLFRGRVTWTGYLASESVGSYLKAADACCLPFHEGASLRHGSLIAAIVQGVPIITTAKGPSGPADGLPRLVSDQNALLVPPRNPAALVAAVDRLIDNPSLREALSRGARELADDFRWDVIARDTVRLYESTIRRRG